MPMSVMFEESNDPKVEVEILLFDQIHRIVHYMKDGMDDRVAAKQARTGSNLLIGRTIEI